MGNELTPQEQEIEAIVNMELRRLEGVRARHARESTAQAGVAFAVSRESVRKAKVVRNTFSDGEELVAAGKASVDKLYRLAKGDNRAALYIKVPPELKERLQDAAFWRGVTLAELVIDSLTQIFG